jgi:hypothetical protein
MSKRTSDASSPEMERAGEEESRSLRYRRVLSSRSIVLPICTCIANHFNTKKNHIFPKNLMFSNSGLEMAYVLTLLPGRVFQVFQVAGGEEEREKGENIDNLFTIIISVHIY